MSLSGANVTLTAGTNIDSNFGDITATAGNVQATAVGTLNTTNLTVNSAAGNVTLNAGSTITTNAVTAAAGNIALTSSAGDVNILSPYAAKNITVNAVSGISAGQLTASAGLITLTSTGVANDILLNGDLSATGAGPAINVTSGHDILLHSVNLTNTSGGVKLTAANTVNINNFDACGGPCAGLRSITAPGNIDITATAGAITRPSMTAWRPERGKRDTHRGHQYR